MTRHECGKEEDPRPTRASVEEDAVREQQLEGKQREGDLDARRAAVDKVAIEDVRPRGGREALAAKDVQQVSELAVQVADDGDGAAGRHVVAPYVWELKCENRVLVWRAIVAGKMTSLPEPAGS